MMETEQIDTTSAKTALGSEELKGMRALFACPTYGPVDPECARDQRVEIMTSAKHGLEWAGDTSTDRMGYGPARNHVCNRLYVEPGLADGVMWMDSDIRTHGGAVTQLLHSVRKFEADFVSGIYHQRGGTFLPVFYHFNDEAGKFQHYVNYPENSLLPVDGCGFGFVWTSLKLIQAIADSPDFDRKAGWFPDNRDSGGFGEDLSFCQQASKVGVQLYVNTAVQVGHLGEPEVIGKAHFEEAQERRKEEGFVEPLKARQWGVKDDWV